MYQGFTNYLNALAMQDRALRDELGDQTVAFARLLKRYPLIEPGDEGTVEAFDDYARQVLGYADRTARLRELMHAYLDDEELARLLPQDGTDAGAGRLPTEVGTADLKNVAKGRIIARTLAEMLLEIAGPASVVEAAKAATAGPAAPKRPRVDELLARQPSGRALDSLLDKPFGAPSATPRAATTAAERLGAAPDIAIEAHEPASAASSPTAAAASAPRDFIAVAHDVEAGEAKWTLGREARRLRPRQRYKIRFGVSRPHDASLITGDAAIGDVPADGLNTRWIVTSTDVAFEADDSTAQVRQHDGFCEARFDLFIPPDGDSAFVHVGVRTGDTVSGTLHIQIRALRADQSAELYRELSATLSERFDVVADQPVTLAAHTLPRPQHEWTTPPFHVQIRILNGLASVTTVRGQSIRDYSFAKPFGASTQTVAAQISAVRDALERLRERWSDDFDALDDEDLVARLPSHRGALQIRGDDGWHPLPMLADADHLARHQRMIDSDEWLALASAGHALYQACFPADSPLRPMLDALPPGSRIDFQWTRDFDPNFVPHLPWALMYREAPDVTRRRPIDAEGFLGLRYRIGSMAWPIRQASRALGPPDQAQSLNLLYWGVRDEAVSAESRWQAAQFKGWGRQVLPAGDTADAKRQLVIALDAPAPSPVGVLYLYCHCGVGDGDRVTLRFGDSSKPVDVITQAELSQQPLADGPIVFANACSTANSSPHQMGLFESLCFQRGARSFIGTETKVPVRLASKFAWLFFQFFDRRFDARPMAAGEALTQARLFLWTQYRNVGGLFYTQVNHYDLFQASDREVRELRD